MSETARILINLEYRTNRIRADKFLHSIGAITNNKLDFGNCPDCGGRGCHVFYCPFCGGQGCKRCEKVECKTCHGKGKVWTDDKGNVIPESEVF